MTTEDADLLLVLAPVRDGDDGSGFVPGTTQIDADCGHRAWISPSSVGATLGVSTRTICTGCRPLGGKDDEPVPGARRALAELVGPVLAEKLIAAGMEHIRRGGTFR